MSDAATFKTLDSIKLLKWMYENGYFSLIAADMIADEIEKGTFDPTESSASEAEDEVAQLKAELASIGKVAAIGLKKNAPYDIKLSLQAIEMAVNSYNE